MLTHPRDGRDSPLKYTRVVPRGRYVTATRLSYLLQGILKPRREDGCVLLEFMDRSLGNLFGNLAKHPC